VTAYDAVPCVNDELNAQLDVPTSKLPLFTNIDPVNTALPLTDNDPVNE